MKKRFLTALIGTAMSVAVLAGCTTQTQEPAEQTTPAAQEAATPTEAAAPVEAGTIPTDYKYYFSMDGGESGISIAKKDGAAVVKTDDEAIYVNGVKGQALYLDGTKGAKLDVNGVGDVYTVSYWMYSVRNAQHMPTLQYGPDVHGDATGSEHWVNFTWEPFNPEDTSVTTFPIVWSYDQANGGDRIYWYPDWLDNKTGQWMNITMTVDPTEVDATGNFIIAHLYLNGEELVGKGSDGDRPVTVVNGTMAPSDNYDFLLGVNYWDTPYKGAFDEIYVYDRVLDASEVKALYEAGDPSSKFDIPEREIVIEENPAALDKLGTTDMDMAFWSDWSEAIKIEDGKTKLITLKNYSDGMETWRNYVMAFTSQPHEAHVDPNTVDGNKEWVVVRADEWAWIGDINPDSANAADYFESNHLWGNWDTWKKSVMTDATVNLQISREGEEIRIVADNVDYNGASNVMNYTVKKTGMTDADDCYVTLLGEGCYIEILAIEDPVDVVADASAIDHVGTTDLAGGFWMDWTDAYELKDGDSKTVEMTNFGSGANNWENYVLAFTNTQTKGHSAPADQSADYAEYAVLRADAYGWGDASYAAEFSTSWDDWAAWLKMMKNAKVKMVIKRDGGTITVDTTFTGADGTEYTESAKVTSTLTAADPCYFFFTNERCYNDILSVK